MAQKTEKEETEFKSVPESITPCINNCGKNMCQNCFATSASTATSSSIIEQQKLRSNRSSSPTSSPIVKLVNPLKGKRDLFEMNGGESNDYFPMKKAVNRCSGCRKKVGLTGFRCRCGELFCADHRYSDRHDCSFDYKAAGREAIARENPVVKAAKIVKI